MTWLNGEMMTSTLFPCVFLHSPSETPTALLPPFLFSILRSVSHCRKILMRARCYEEEDFFCSTGGLDLFDEIPEIELHQDLDHVTSLLRNALKSFESHPPSSVSKALPSEVRPSISSKSPPTSSSENSNLTIHLYGKFE